MSRVFGNCYETMSEAARDLKEVSIWVPSSSVQDMKIKGNSQYDMRELIGYSFTLVDWPDLDNLFHLHPTRDWADHEFYERTSSDYINPGIAWSLRSDMWEPMRVRNEGRFAYTYNERIRVSLQRVIEELVRNPTSRQSVVAIWNPSIDVHKLGIDRVPCSMYYQFLIRAGKLHMIYNMRSSDICGHLGNDIYLALKMLMYVTDQVAVHTPEIDGHLHYGHLHMSMSSFHTFRKDSEKLERFLTMR